MTQDISLANALKMYRENNGMTQQAMADWLEITRSHYSRMESGKATNPRLKTFWKFYQSQVRIEVKANCNQSNDHMHLR